MAFLGWLRQASCAMWAEFIRNPKVYALLVGQPILLGGIIGVLVRGERWGQAHYQLETQRYVILILAFTHLVVTIAMAAVKVEAKVRDMSLEVGSEGQIHVEGQIQADVTATGGSA